MPLRAQQSGLQGGIPQVSRHLRDRRIRRECSRTAGHVSTAKTPRGLFNSLTVIPDGRIVHAALSAAPPTVVGISDLGLGVLASVREPCEEANDSDGFS